MFDDPKLVNDAIFCACATVGQLLHAVKKWLAGEADNPITWIISHPKRTVAAVITNLTGMVYLVSTGALTGMALEAVIIFGMWQGLGTDSLLNKGDRPEWTEEKRKEAAK